MRINDVLSEWSKDSTIDKVMLDESTLVTPNLHSKYLMYLMDAKKQLRETTNNRKNFPASERRGNPQYESLQEYEKETEDIITACEEILSAIRQRDWQIKNIITWRQFTQCSDV